MTNIDWSRLVIGMLGGDRREQEIARLAAATGAQVRAHGFPWPEGGIAGVLSPEDRFENHIEDTIAAGGGLCHCDIVEMVVREAPHQINELIGWGTHFDEEDGHLALTREGGHSHRRIVHALGDATGSEVMRAIIARARQTPVSWELLKELFEQPYAALALRETGRRLDRGDSAHAVVGQVRWWVSAKLAIDQPERVKSALGALLRTDLALKSSGGDERVLLERLVVELSGRPLQRRW